MPSTAAAPTASRNEWLLLAAEQVQTAGDTWATWAVRVDLGGAGARTPFPSVILRLSLLAGDQKVPAAGPSLLRVGLVRSGATGGDKLFV